MPTHSSLIWLEQHCLLCTITILSYQKQESSSSTWGSGLVHFHCSQGNTRNHSHPPHHCNLLLHYLHSNFYNFHNKFHKAETLHPHMPHIAPHNHRRLQSFHNNQETSQVSPLYSVALFPKFHQCSSSTNVHSTKHNNYIWND